jgi:hypothetical protein
MEMDANEVYSTLLITCNSKALIRPFKRANYGKRRLKKRLRILVGRPCTKEYPRPKPWQPAVWIPIKHALCAMFVMRTPDTSSPECPFTREVLRLIWQWCSLAGTPTQASPSLSTTDWLSCCAVVVKPRPQRQTMGILLYIWWNVWKERNRRVFDFIQKNEFQVVSAAKEDLDLFNLAHHPPVP